MDQHALAGPHVSGAVKHLIGCGPAEDERSGLCGIDTVGYAREIGGAKDPVGGVRPDDRHVGDALTNPKVLHTFAELVDLADDIVAHDEGDTARRGLGIEVLADEHVGVVEARCEYLDPNLTRSWNRQWDIDDLKPVGVTESHDLDGPVQRLGHGSPPSGTKDALGSG